LQKKRRSSIPREKNRTDPRSFFAYSYGEMSREKAIRMARLALRLDGRKNKDADQHGPKRETSVFHQDIERRCEGKDSKVARLDLKGFGGGEEKPSSRAQNSGLEGDKRRKVGHPVRRTGSPHPVRQTRARGKKRKRGKRRSTTSTISHVSAWRQAGRKIQRSRRLHPSFAVREKTYRFLRPKGEKLETPLFSKASRREKKPEP